MADPTLSERISAQDDVARYLSQLRALLENTYGCSAEAFHGMNEELKDSYLWACADLADRAQEALQRMGNPLRVAA